MTKKKKIGKSSPKQASKLQVFFLGILVGLALFWIPSDHEFSKVTFTDRTSQPLILEQLPIAAPLIQRDGYTLSYNGQTRNAHWVYHKLTEATLNKKTSREECDFKEDLNLPEQIRSTKADYLESGFDRGHLCPAADCETQQALENSFFLSNIAPQTPAFNRGYWKMAEQHVRDLVKHYKTVHVFSGPLYLSSKGRDGKNYVKYEVIGPHNVAVPTHFFMLLFVEPSSGKMLSKGYIMPNKSIDAKTPLKKFSATIEEIERASGVIFTQIQSLLN